MESVHDLYSTLLDFSRVLWLLQGQLFDGLRITLESSRQLQNWSNSLLTLELLMAVTLFLRFLDYMHRTGNRAPEVKPSMPETTALGAAMAAGAAEGVSVWSLNPADITEVTSEKFEPQINPEESELRYARWKKAVQRAMNWETTEPVNNGNGRFLLDVTTACILIL
ncbi:hypothetical protein DNTS_006748 [Danionella cerebrum]|uniref:Carbohydrate kinase FGGY C-terminal domain-containing protein n=1 Tax=Danionella cerebrum TaxID=2873325 RepID=A0A553QZA7_9TELE|nr:hypothetical protein DNTS_006748 [Danionella translucida]